MHFGGILTLPVAGALQHLAREGQEGLGMLPYGQGGHARLPEAGEG
jgi:hypothetical protein